MLRDQVAMNRLTLRFRRFRRVAGDLISCTNWKVISLYVLSNVFDGRELNGIERA